MFNPKKEKGGHLSLSEKKWQFIKYKRKWLDAIHTGLNESRKRWERVSVRVRRDSTEKPADKAVERTNLCKQKRAHPDDSSQEQGKVFEESRMIEFLSLTPLLFELEKAQNHPEGHYDLSPWGFWFSSSGWEWGAKNFVFLTKLRVLETVLWKPLFQNRWKSFNYMSYRLLSRIGKICIDTFSNKVKNTYPEII